MLRGLYTPIRFSTVFKEDNFCDCFPAHKGPTEKGSSLKGKNLLPLGTNSFLFEKTLFQRGGKSILKGLPPLKMYHFYLNYSKSLIS